MRLAPFNIVCTAPMLATSLLAHLGIFWPVFVQAVLERDHGSAAYNFIW